jgi:hypothetical protein
VQFPCSIPSPHHSTLIYTITTLRLPSHPPRYFINDTPSSPYSIPLHLLLLSPYLTVRDETCSSITLPISPPNFSSRLIHGSLHTISSSSSCLRAKILRFVPGARSFKHSFGLARCFGFISTGIRNFRRSFGCARYPSFVLRRGSLRPRRWMESYWCICAWRARREDDLVRDEMGPSLLLELRDIFEERGW